MTLVASNTGGGNSTPIEALEPGNYPSRVAQVIDLGLQAQRPYEGKTKAPANEIMVTYELVTEFLKDEDGKDREDKPRWVSERFPLYSLGSDRARSTIRYNALDPKMTNGGDWSLMADTPCLVAVVNNKSKANGKVYNNVGGVTQPIKGMPVPAMVNDTKVFTLDEPDMDVFRALPDWIQGVITDNLEFNGSKLQEKLGVIPAADPSATPDPDAEANADEPTDSDDVPF